MGELSKQREEMVRGSLEVLKSNVGKAAKVLVDLLSSKSEMIRRGAANDILQFTVKSIELEDFHRRLSILEESLAQRRP